MRELWRSLGYRGTKDTEGLDTPTKEFRKVIIYKSEADRLALLALQYLETETGGDLFGYWTHTGSPIVSYVIGPGRQSKHNRTSFYQDENYLRDVGTELYDQHGLQHIGEWHSHHRLGLNRPSQGDMDTVRSGMSQKHWSRFLLLITTVEGENIGMVLQNYFLFSDSARDPDPLRIFSLPGVSPFRRSGDDAREEELRRDSEIFWRPGPFTPGTRRLADEVFKSTWFTSAEGKALLVRIAKQFASAGISCRMIPTDDGQTLKLELPDATLVLGSQFPNEPPQWIASKQPSNYPPWSPGVELVDWYITTKQKYAFGNCGQERK